MQQMHFCELRYFRCNSTLISVFHADGRVSCWDQLYHHMLLVSFPLEFNFQKITLAALRM
jgi:hypothetical protein